MSAVHNIVAARWNGVLDEVRPVREGHVSAVLGNGFEVAGLDAAVGDRVEVLDGDRIINGKVVALTASQALIASYERVTGLRVGRACRTATQGHGIPSGDSLLGRVVDALGRPIDSRPVDRRHTIADNTQAPNPLTRQLISTPFPVGVRSIDAFTPLAAGQRVGVFAGSGVGKSTLLSMMVNGSDADVIVVGLVGERGREVREFIENQLGADGLARSVVVVATGDETALMRVTAAETATAIAEDFRDNGRRVLLVIDSITRFAMAHREIGLAAGELPAARGYPPSTMSVLPQLLERAGNSEFGTMTAIYTVLVDGDDMDEPVADTVRGILDGHIVLSRELANMGHFPAVDVLASVSRLSSVVYTDEQEELVRRARLLLGEFAAARDLIDVGAYVPGSNALIDEAIARRPGLNSFLQQGENEMSDIDRTWLALADALTKEIPS